MRKNASIQDYVAKVTKMLAKHRRGANGYSSIEHLVHVHGVPMTPIRQDDWPAWVKFASIRECFRNAALLVLEHHDELIYCEGYAMGVFPVLHAWAVDQQGRVIDNTWGDTGTSYVGCAIRTDFLRVQLTRQKVYGLMDQPGRWPLFEMPPEKWKHPIMERIAT